MSKQIEDLTVRETQEAESFGLSPVKYLALCEKLDARLRPRIAEDCAAQNQANIRKNIEATIRKEYAEEMRKQLWAEMTPKITETLRSNLRIEVEKELGAKLTAEAVEKAKEELRAHVPTPDERKAYRMWALDAEVDCRARAEVASSRLEAARSSLAWNRRRLPIGMALLCATGPVMLKYATPIGPTPVGLTMTGILVILAIYSFVRYTQVRDEHVDLIKHRANLVSEYLQVVDHLRHFQVSTMIMNFLSDIERRVDNLRNSKSHIDERFAPKTEDLDSARDRAKTRALTENLSDLLGFDPSRKEG